MHRHGHFVKGKYQSNHQLRYRIIAEGVETQEEMELLRSWNVDMIQGYYFSRPLPPGDLLRLLTEEAVEQM